ncbi:MAG: hypothetical protein IJ736_03105 [Firmicutes bacterium]|nr:hypothetical protein [Bacillota bacterium]
MTFKTRCVLLYCMPYSIEDENTGRTNEGISTTYLPTVDLGSVVSDNGSLGISTVKQSLPMSWLKRLPTVPGIYDIDFEMRAVGGKPVMVPVDISFVSAVSILADGKDAK